MAYLWESNFVVLHLNKHFRKLRFIKKRLSCLGRCYDAGKNLIDPAEWCHGRVLTISRDIFKDTLLAPIREVHLFSSHSACLLGKFKTDQIFKRIKASRLEIYFL